MFKTLQEAQEAWNGEVRNVFFKYNIKINGHGESFVADVWHSAHSAGRKEIEEVLKENEGNFLSSHRIQHILAGRSCGLEKLEALRK